MQVTSTFRLVSLIGCGLALITPGCPLDKAEILESLTARCVSATESLPDGAWVCPQSKTVECDRAALTPETLYVRQSNGVSCEGESLKVSGSGALTLGAYTVTVSNQNDEQVCSAQLVVRDTQPPSVEAHTIVLWPPNHKMHSVAIADCVKASDACDPNVQASFIWASSDEPDDALGDGNTSPDIQIDDCEHVSVRAEREGPSDGRVYTLGVRVRDQSGHETETQCRVIVAHDQSGKARSADGETISGVMGAAGHSGASASSAASANRGGGKANGAANGASSHGNAADAGMSENRPTPESGMAGAGGSDAGVEGDSAGAAARTNVAVASGEAYRIIFDGANGTPSCGQTTEAPDAGVVDSGPSEVDAGASTDIPDDQEDASTPSESNGSLPPE